MEFRALAISMLLVIPPVCAAQVRPRPNQVPAGPPPYMQQLKSYDQEGPVTKVVLKNNLTVLVVEAHANPLVEVLTRVNFGYRDDPEALPGVARMIEQMLFRGTTNRSAALIASDLKALGGRLDHGTEYDYTWFRTIAPAMQWKKLLEIQADAYQNPVFDAQELKRQIDVAAGESRDELDNPDGLLAAKLLATGIAGESARRGPWVTKDALSRIPRDRLASAFKTGYATERAIVVICGDILPPDVLNAVASLYTTAKPSGGAPTSAQGSDFSPGFRYAQVRAAGSVAKMAIGFHVPADSASDYPAIEALRVVLGTGESSILNRRLKNQKGIVYGAGAFLSHSGANGVLTLEMDLAPKDLDRAQIAAFTEFEILKRQKESDGELERAIAQLKREYWENTMMVSGVAERYARLEAQGSWKDGNGYLARIGRVQWADVVRAATRYLTLENCAVVEYLPAESEPRNVSDEILQNTLKQLLAPSVEAEIAARTKSPVEGLTIPEEGSPFKPSPVHYPFQTASILRGPQLFIREDHSMPVIHLGFFFAGGKLREVKANSGITSLMVRTMFSGDTKTRSAEQIFRQLEVYGGILTPVVDDDYFGFRLSVLSEHAEAALDLISELVKSPKMDPEEIARQKAIQTAALRSRSDFDVACGRLSAALFQDHAYALDTNGTEEGVAGITPDAVRAWHTLYVADKKPIITVIGDTQGTSLAGYFVQHFSGSRYEDVEVAEKFPKGLEKKSVLESNSSSAASMVAIGFQAPPEYDDDSFPLTVFQTCAAGLAGRLTTPIQERIPSARHVAVEYVPKLRGGSIRIRASVAPADEELAQTVMLEELQKALTSQLSYRDYRAAMNTASADLVISQQDHFAQIAAAMGCILAGKGIDGLLEFGNRLQEVKQPDLQDVAQRFIKTDKSVILRVHGKS